MVFRRKERRKTFFSAGLFVFFFCNSVAFLRCFWHFLLILSRDQVSVGCVPSACLFLASEIPVYRRDHGNFLSYLRLDVLLRHLIIVLFAAVFTSVPWLFRLYFFYFSSFSDWPELAIRGLFLNRRLRILSRLCVVIISMAECRP